MLLMHCTEDDARLSAMVLRAMSASARRLLAECVEKQEVKRTKLSLAALALEHEGFVRIVCPISGRGEHHLLYPKLAGEEALEALDGVVNEHRA